MKIFNAHVGGPNNAHNNARRRCEDFQNQKQSVSYAMTSHTEKSHIEYEESLRAVVGVVRFLVSQGLAFHGDNVTTTFKKVDSCRMSSATTPSLGYWMASASLVAAQTLSIGVQRIQRSPEPLTMKLFLISLPHRTT